MPFFQTGLIAPILGEIAGLIVEINNGSKGTKRAVVASTTAAASLVVGAATVDPGGAAVGLGAAVVQGISENGSLLDENGRVHIGTRIWLHDFGS